MLKLRALPAASFLIGKRVDNGGVGEIATTADYVNLAINAPTAIQKMRAQREKNKRGNKGVGSAEPVPNNNRARKTSKTPR